MIKDPITNEEFDSYLSDEELEDIMSKRYIVEKKSIELNEAADKELAKANKILSQAQALRADAIETMDAFDRSFLPHVRATVMHAREHYYRTETPTAYYVLHCRVPKKPKPQYDTTDKELINWTVEHCPEAISAPKIAKTKLNRYLEHLDKDKLPENVKFEVPKPSFQITKLK